jgi:hypothetical protein
MTGGPHVKEFTGIKLNPNLGSWLETNSYKGWKKSIKILIEWMIWNNFCYWHFVSNSTNVEINLRFLFKFEYKRDVHLEILCSLL